MKKFLLIALTATLFCVELHAQETINFSKDSKSKSSKKRKRSSEQNIVKIAPINFIAGSIPLFYERRLTDFLSVQAGLGITTKNFLKIWANNLDFSSSGSGSYKYTWNGTSDTYQDYYSQSDFTNRKASIGYHFSVQPRFYFNSEGLDGGYFSIGYDLNNYKTSSQKIQTGFTNSGEPEFTSAYFNESEKVSDISVNFGGQTLYDNLSFDYSFGIALRSTNATRYAFTYDNAGSWIDGYSTLNKTTPAFVFALRLGYHF